VTMRRIVFPNRRHRVYGAEWTLARDNDIAVGCDSEIERTQFEIRDQPTGLRGRASIEGQYSVIALPLGADSQGEEQPPVTTECKPSGERYDPWRQQML